jgi:hypothetical protein
VRYTKLFWRGRLVTWSGVLYVRRRFSSFCWCLLWYRNRSLRKQTVYASCFASDSLISRNNPWIIRSDNLSKNLSSSSDFRAYRFTLDVISFAEALRIATARRCSLSNAPFRASRDALATGVTVVEFLSSLCGGVARLMRTGIFVPSSCRGFMYKSRVV